MLIYEAGPTKNLRRQIVHRVLSNPTANELQTDERTASQKTRKKNLQKGLHLYTHRSMFLLFARLKPKMPFLARMSSDMGSIPFWLITTNCLGFSPFLLLEPSTAWSHTRFLSSTIFFNRLSMNLRSDSTSFSRCSAEE